MQSDPTHLASRLRRAPSRAVVAGAVIIGLALVGCLTDNRALIFHKSAEPDGTAQLGGNGSDKLRAVAGDTVAKTENRLQLPSGIDSHSADPLVIGSTPHITDDPQLGGPASGATLEGSEIFSSFSAPSLSATRVDGPDAWTPNPTDKSTDATLLAPPTWGVHGQFNVEFGSLNAAAGKGSSLDSYDWVLAHVPVHQVGASSDISSLFRPSVGLTGDTALDLLSAPPESTPSVGVGSGNPDIPFSSTPEPTTLTLLGLSSGGLLVRRRRTRSPKPPG
jgi:hypothetical protein